MKKAFAALLATIVGLFGYQIVDKTLEERVTGLEQQVSSQQEEIESLHGIGKYSESGDIPGTPIIGGTADEYVPKVGDVTAYTGQTTFTFRVYCDGRVKDITYSRYGTEDDVKADGDNQPGDDSNVNYYVDDYTVTVENATRTVLDVKEHVTVFRGKSGETESLVMGRSVTYKYAVKGKADPALAGYTLTAHYSSVTIEADGSFSVESTRSERDPANDYNNINMIINK
ncbi:MAG: hypothetical protein K6F64_07535 [Clostridia bacterium]|nr:hypothetical protein [Clostridia bacterium]